jgi:DNA-directed RNA polymerase specialized sigma24 family protein
MPEETNPSSSWPRTDWSEIQAAADSVGKDAELLDTLLRRYQAAIRAYLQKVFPSLQDHHEEYAHEFMTDRMLKEGWLKRADPNRGRFRDFLKISLRRFVLDRRRRRDVRNPPEPLVEAEDEIPDEAAACEAYDRAWAAAVVAEALRRMETNCRDPGKDQPRRRQTWEVFELRLLKPIFEDAQPAPYEDVIQRFGFSSPSEAFNTLASAKRIFRSHVLAVVREYAGRDEATAMEMDALRDAVMGICDRNLSRECKMHRPGSYEPMET